MDSIFMLFVTIVATATFRANALGDAVSAESQAILKKFAFDQLSDCFWMVSY